MASDVTSAVERGDWLVAHRREMERGESAWLGELARFDIEGGWAADGQLSCATWLMWRSGMARATAYEKLRIAHELRRRPTVADAFADGLISYSAVRAITRIDAASADLDEALVNLAVSGSILDVERAVRYWQLHADQHRPHPTRPSPGGCASCAMGMAPGASKRP